MRPISRLDWMRYGPFLAQLVVTRRCNLACAYCTEYDKTSAPVPYGELRRRLLRLRDLRAWAVSLLGGEPTLHPDLLRILRVMRGLGFKRRMMISNGLLLTPELIDGLNREGLTDLNVSVDGVKRTASTVKVLDALKGRLDLLARKARFRVVLNTVVGAAPREEVLAVADYARSRGFTPRVLLIHDERGQLDLGPEGTVLYREVQRRLGRCARGGRRYRERLIRDGEAPFRCRSGARYLYIDEHGVARWCAQTRGAFGKDLMSYGLDDLRENFYAGKPCSARCSVGCSRDASAFDEWRSQRAA